MSMTFVRRALLALALGAGLAVAPVTAAQAGPPIWSSWDVAHSGQCLDVRDYSTSNNAVVQQYTCHGGTNQWWYQVAVTSVPGYYHFVNRRSWKCLTVRDGSVLPHARLVQYTCNPGGVTTHQTWR